MENLRGTRGHSLCGASSFGGHCVLNTCVRARAGEGLTIQIVAYKYMQQMTQARARAVRVKSLGSPIIGQPKVIGDAPLQTRAAARTSSC